ncbi:DNRLRE domain-containing protein [Streptomyces sp. NPDC001312]|uniref:golvesin C-terminal-like domain-containing protein n=1 Tax=Streptomyces sp. NPDC001312 TaxID=3364561 RepID=UPI0036B25273
MVPKFRRLLSVAVVGALCAPLLQTPAFAAAGQGSGDDGPGLVDTIAGWFSDGDKAERKPTHSKDPDVPQRQHLPRGKKSPKATRVKELTGKRTANARYWRLSDGRIEAEISSRATTYRAGKEWKPIDTTVSATGREGFDYANTTNAGRSYFGSDPRRLMRYEAESGESVTFGLVDDGRDAGKLKPRAKGSTVRYSDALGGADLVYDVRTGEVKEDIVLNERPATASQRFTFRITTEGLTPKLLKSGAIDLIGELSKKPVLTIPAPFMTDAGKARSGAVSQRLVKDGGAWRLTVVPDAKWLAAPERRYPVAIDPSVVVATQVPGMQDTMIASQAPTFNYNNSDGKGTRYPLNVGTNAYGIIRSLVKFPLGAIPKNTKIDSAQLSLYYDKTHTTNANSVSIEAHRATAAWDETTATWNSAQGITGELSGTSVTVDDGDPETAAVGVWPVVATTGGINIGNDYAYNKNTATGESYTWQPKLPESGTYTVDVHHAGTSDATTAAPFTVTYNGGTAPYTVNQTTGTSGVWTTLGSHSFAAGTAGKVVLGDTGDSTKRTIADAVRFTKAAKVTKGANAANSVRHNFSVTDTVQSWINGTYTNNGFVLKAADESVLGKGGPSYVSSELNNIEVPNSYNPHRLDEMVVAPKLTVVYGRPGVTLAAPTTIHDTGAELSWSAYADPSTAPGDDIVEYQVHRGTTPDFKPSAATLVAPVSKNTRKYTDSSAEPSTSYAEDGVHSYYYMVAVKTQDGQLITAPTQRATVPYATQTSQIIQTGTTDTTLSSTESTTAHDTVSSNGAAQKWLAVGNNSSTLGVTRALVKFPTPTPLPPGARLFSAAVSLWSASTTSYATGAAFDLHGLGKDFDEAAATWIKADATTNWTKAGGDFGSLQSQESSARTDESGWHGFEATSLAQSWLDDPASNKGVLLKLANETSTGPQEQTMFLSSEASEAQLRPLLSLTYTDTTRTYSAPETPARMIPGDTITTPVTITNTTKSRWKTSDYALSYHWSLPDGTDVTNGGNQIHTTIPEGMEGGYLLPGETATANTQVKAPINSDSGNKRTEYNLTWDVYNKTTGQWLSQSAGITGISQRVAVEDPTSDQLGLEKFYSYAGKNTGAGSTLMNNVHAGNNVWSYNIFNNPGRGLSTFARLSYNSLDTSDTGLGQGWSGQAAAPLRMGAALDFHPNPKPTEVTLPDGDGTSHIFRWDTATSTWKAPAGVHYLLEQVAGVDCNPSKEAAMRAWKMTRPDRTQFWYDCDGYLTSVVDKNGNTQTYTYEKLTSGNKRAKLLRYITDPAGRKTLEIEYYAKGESYPYIDDAGAKLTGSKLTNPDIIDHAKSMTDVSGRKVSFVYSDKGLLREMTDGDGSTQPKVFTFTYDATQGKKNVKLVEVTDPRGHATSLDYYYPQTGDDPKFHWRAKTIVDRLGGSTRFEYTDPDGTAGSTIQTKVTDAEDHSSTYVTDGYGRATRITNAKSQPTKLGWDADNNVTRLEEANGAVTTYAYDPKTGYPLEQKDAEANKKGTAPATFTYQTGLNGYTADLYQKKSPEGRTWQFGYDTFGNLKTVTDPKGVATGSGYTTKYEYNAYGQLTKATDANGNPTTYSGFEPTGYPKTITDAKSNSTTYAYDERGQVTQVTDALGKKTTQTYDTYGRPLVNTVPKEQDKGVLITTPAPVYDANDNVTKSTAPNGAVSTAVYDDADQVTSATAPANNQTDPRTTTYTYDKVGNPKTTTEPKGTATTADATDYITTNHYDEIYQLTSAVNASGDKVSYEYDNVGNTTKVIDPKKNATADTTDYTTKTDYDLNHRVTAVTDAAGNITKREYDRDSLVTSTTDAENNTTTITYDERGKQTEVTVPHEGTTTRSTKYEYDQVGNTTKVLTPRAVAAGSTTAFTARTEYDALNRPVKQYQPYDPADTRYNNPNVYTQTVYDAVGRVERTSLPSSEGETVRNDTTYGYFDNGWVRSSTDPWDIVTTYDYNDVSQQTQRTLTSAGGSSDRTMSWSYYPDGSLKARSDDGVPVGKSVVLVDNSDTQNTSSTGTWTKGSTTGQQGYDHATHAAGTGTDAFTWTLNIPKDGTYTAYVKFPKVTGAATTAKYTVTHSTGTTDKTIDQNASANQGTWVALGSYSFKQGNNAKLQLFQNTGGTVVADGVKLVRDTRGDPADTEKNNFAYTYDLNGNLTGIDDTSSTAKTDAYTIAYTGLNQIQKVTEALAGQEKKSTSYTYDANGQPDTVTHPDQFSKYTYDLRELVKTVSVGKTATDASPKVSSYTYTDRGQKLKETKANGNTVDYTYYLDAALKSTTEKKPNGTLVSSHTYAYDPNGNKAQDVAKKMNADDQSAYLSSTTDYTYDPADRLKEAAKTGNGAGTETYVHDDNANVIRQTVGGTKTDYDYDRNRLLSAITGTSTANYNYDPFGRMESVVAADKVIERSTYDGFDHVVKSQKMDDTGAMKSTTYTFDPLDRTASKTADGKTTDYEYLGLSSEVLDEKVAGTLTKSYQYSPWGERLSQIKHNSDGTTEDGYYGYNSHTDVETLTDKNGDTKATYGYTAYGNDDKSEFTGIDKPNTADPTKEAYNPYRFNAKRWDAQSGTYDMGFRDYNPGLNRFTTRDMYNGALADMGLGADPYTGNRYAFTGGNPTSRAEYDGHTSCDITGMCGGVYRETPMIKAEQREGAAISAVRSGSLTSYTGNDSPKTPNDNAPFNSKEPTPSEHDYFMNHVLPEYEALIKAAEAAGWGLTAKLWKHYRDASGSNYDVNFNYLKNDPGLRNVVQGQLDDWQAQALASCQSGGACKFKADSKWLGVNLESNDNHFGIGHGQVRVTGTAMSDGTSVGMTFNVQVYKDWNFDKDKTALAINLSRYAAMHEYGYAQEFAMTSQSPAYGYNNMYANSWG